MQKMRLPRNMRIKKNEDGQISIFMIKANLTISLRQLVKKAELTPSMVNYLKEYESRLEKDKEGKIKDVRTFERIRTILSKPTLEKDLILDKDMKVLDCRYTENHYRKLGYKGYDDFKIQQEIAEKKKEEIRNKNKQEEEKKNANAKK